MRQCDAMPGVRGWWDDVVAAARFVRHVPGFLRHPLTFDEACAALRRRLERRETDFLELIRDAVYAVEDHPYHRLLRLAGCAYGDLERLVHQDGLEGALVQLFRHGVYLTVDEQKGRRPAIRGSSVIHMEPRRLRNPWLTAHMEGTSSGSRGPRTAIVVDLEFMRERMVNTTLFYVSRGIHGWRNALWEVPGAGALIHVLRLAAMGVVPDQWFSQVDPGAAGLHPRYRWSARALRLGGRLGGMPLPAPRYVPIDDPRPIVRWMTDALREGHTPHLDTFPTSAVRVCQSALAAGLDLRGAHFSLIGEPFTPARQAVIKSAGAEAVSRYGTIECPAIGWGCLGSDIADDHHHAHDFWPLIQPGPHAAPAELPANALLVSTLRRHSPLILINASMGDQADLVPQACGCPLERVGWTRHLRNIRSFEKLTAGGMTFFDADITRALEDVLPRRFGGGPTDYQLVEQEGPDGRPTLRLLVHPGVGPVEPAAVADTLLSTLGAGAGAERIMTMQWRQARLLHVERRAPISTAGGKILHLHQVSPGGPGR